jgi:hypothetical protein
MLAFIVMAGEGPPCTTFLTAGCKVVDAGFVGMARWGRPYVDFSRVGIIVLFCSTRCSCKILNECRSADGSLLRGTCDCSGHDVVRPVSIAPPQARHPTARRDPGVTANVAVTIILPASPWSANAKEIRR